MRVAFDATPLLAPGTGVATFVGGAFSALADRDDVHLSAYALSWRGRKRLGAALPRGVRRVTRPMVAKPMRWAWTRADIAPVEWWTGEVDVVHGTNYVVPPSRTARRIVTVHDLTAVRYPELCTPDVRLYPALVRRAIAGGAFVHAPSAAVAAEVVETLGASPDRVRAIHHGIDAPSETFTPPLQGGKCLGLDTADGPYVLALGTVEPRKNLPALVRAFDRIAGQRSRLRLVIAGPDGWGTDELRAALAAARHSDRVVRIGYVGDADRAQLLAGASVLAYPSLYEGFGLPPLEAMAAGVPVVASNAGSLPEVLGDAAILVAPEDEEALAVALARVLDDADEALRLKTLGWERAKTYTWERCATGLAMLYRDAVAT